MKKNIIGWSVFIILSLIPLFLLVFLSPDKQNLFTYSEMTHELGQLAALVGMTMFALTFILSTRLKSIEDMFGGLDKVYMAHGVFGGTALILVLFHPILLVLKFIPSNIGLAAYYLLPSSHWSVDFGIIALIGLIGLVYLTLYTKIKYHKWKFSHKFLGLVFIIAVFHIFLIRADGARDYIFNGYYIYAGIVSFIGLIGFSYSLFLKKSLMKEAIYFVESITNKKEVYEFIFVPERKQIEYQSGQFIFVRFFNEKLSKESHPFSIASKSNEKKIRIIVKNLGDFTSNLHNVAVGDKVAIEGPYGRFHCIRSEGSDEIWIAGGIGITPFIGLAEDLKENKQNNKVDLYYSVKTRDELVGSDNLKSIEKINKNFRFFPWITSEKGYITLKDINERSGELKDKDLYICGPPAFKKSLKESLIKLGISEEKICEEDFNFR